MIEVDSATGDAWEVLGEKIRAAGKEDSSGYRRMLAPMLGRREFERVAAQLNITIAEAEDLRARFVADFGEG